MRETGVQSLGQEDALEKDVATHSSTLAGKSYGRRSLVDYTVHGVAKSRTWLSNFTYIHTYICKYTSQFNNSKYREYQGRYSYKAKTSFSGEKNLHREYLWSSQMNLHRVGHNLQLSIKGTIILYVFTSDQWHHMYKMTNQSYISDSLRTELYFG